MIDLIIFLSYIIILRGFIRKNNTVYYSFISKSYDNVNDKIKLTVFGQ
jgi:hypothetical protein